MWTILGTLALVICVGWVLVITADRTLDRMEAELWGEEPEAHAAPSEGPNA